MTSKEDYVTAYLVGKSTCPFTMKANEALASTASGPSAHYLVQGLEINSVLQRVMCDVPSDAPAAVSEEQLCSLVTGYPDVVACRGSDCSVILSGYFPSPGDPYDKTNSDPTYYRELAAMKLNMYLETLQNSPES